MSKQKRTYQEKMKLELSQRCSEALYVTNRVGDYKLKSLPLWVRLDINIS